MQYKSALRATITEGGVDGATPYTCMLRKSLDSEVRP